MNVRPVLPDKKCRLASSIIGGTIRISRVGDVNHTHTGCCFLGEEELVRRWYIPSHVDVEETDMPISGGVASFERVMVELHTPPGIGTIPRYLQEKRHAGPYASLP